MRELAAQPARLRGESGPRHYCGSTLRQEAHHLDLAQRDPTRHRAPVFVRSEGESEPQRSRRSVRRRRFQHAHPSRQLGNNRSPPRTVWARPRAASAARADAGASSGSLTNPYCDLGTHPDLVARLWDELTVRLPAGCRWIVHGAPVLARPSSGIIFAFAEGTHTYALRLPAKERDEALRAGARR
jgi:hypothetical protein